MKSRYWFLERSLARTPNEAVIPDSFLQLLSMQLWCIASTMPAGLAVLGPKSECDVFLMEETESAGFLGSRVEHTFEGQYVITVPSTFVGVVSVIARALDVAGGSDPNFQTRNEHLDAHVIQAASDFAELALVHYTLGDSFLELLPMVPEPERGVIASWNRFDFACFLSGMADQLFVRQRQYAANEVTTGTPSPPIGISEILERVRAEITKVSNSRDAQPTPRRSDRLKSLDIVLWPRLWGPDQRMAILECIVERLGTIRGEVGSTVSMCRDGVCTLTAAGETDSEYGTASYFALMYVVLHELGHAAFDHIHSSVLPLGEPDSTTAPILLELHADWFAIQVLQRVFIVDAAAAGRRDEATARLRAITSAILLTLCLDGLHRQCSLDARESDVLHDHPPTHIRIALLAEWLGVDESTYSTVRDTLVTRLQGASTLLDWPHLIALARPILTAEKCRLEPGRSRLQKVRSAMNATIELFKDESVDAFNTGASQSITESVARVIDVVQHLQAMYSQDPDAERNDKLSAFIARMRQLSSSLKSVAKEAKALAPAIYPLGFVAMVMTTCVRAIQSLVDSDLRPAVPPQYLQLLKSTTPRR